MSIVLDASALLAYLRGEAGGEVVDRLLAEGKSVCYAHAVNLCEVYYDSIREFDRQKAVASIQLLVAAGVTPREDMDTGFWQSVGDRKAPGGVSLADCFCLALADRLGAEVVTGDREEFAPLAEQGICRVRFIR